MNRRAARQIIADAAVAAGIDVVIDKPTRESKVLYPLPRLEFEVVSSPIQQSPGLFARLPGTDPVTHVTHRKRTHQVTFDCRCVLKAGTENELETLISAFLVALPRKTSDADNNLVTVTASKAELGGFGTRVAEAIPERSAAVWVKVTGGIYSDTEVPLIRDVNLVEGLEIGP